MSDRILVVDDSGNTLEIINRTLTKNGYRVSTVSSVDDALRYLEGTKYDLVITDLKMPGVNGMELVRHINENVENTEIIMITGYASLDSAIEAIKTGAAEYLPKPFTSEELLGAVSKTLKRLHERRQIKISDEDINQRFGIIGSSDPMKKVFSMIEKSASVDATVLIEAESGAGKELVARAIHYSSKRANAPFVPINCGGIPEELLESELFGHVKGAFSGATETRAGFFQTAVGGSIFLDEIGEMTKSMQVKLLRALQQKEITMVGARKPENIDVRIIAATNKNLLRMVELGAFRDDLYYRLNVISIGIPPLRERRDDILLLTNNFLTKYCIEIDKKPPNLSDEVIGIFKGYDWPGNVRELENIIKRIAVMVDHSTIYASDLPSNMRYCIQSGPSGLKSLKEVEAEHIKRIIDHADGNKTKAASILGIDRKTLRTKMNEYGIE